MTKKKLKKKNKKMHENLSTMNQKVLHFCQTHFKIKIYVIILISRFILHDRIITNTINMRML